MEEHKKDFIDKAVDFLFSKDGKRLMLILLVSLVIRFFVVSHLMPVADEMVHGTHAINFIEKGTPSHMTQCPLWFYMTDIAYKILNVTLFSARFMSFFFGFLTIILVYLIARMIFDKKVAIVSAFLLAFCPYFMEYARVYMDESLTFFALLAAYLFIKKMKEKGEISLMSAVCLGMAALIKIIAFDFVVTFTLFIIAFIIVKYKRNREWFTKKNIASIFLFFLIILVMFSPVLVYNYLLYKDKGVVDLPFSMYLQINPQFYQGPGLAHGEGFNLSKIPWYFNGAFNSFISMAPIEFALFLLSLLFVFKYRPSEKKWVKFILCLFIIHFLILITAIGLSTHFVPFAALFSMFGAVTLVSISNKIEQKFNLKHILAILLIIIVLANLVMLKEFIFTGSAIGKMRDFTISSFDKDSLVVADARIYRGRIAWMFNDQSYIESSVLSSVVEQLEQFPGEKVPIKTYFIECVPDDCGWGTIAGQKDFNESVEQTVSFFENNSKEIKVISGGGGEGKSNEPYFRVYETSLLLKPQILEVVHQTHEFFFYPVRYENTAGIYDKYQTHGSFGSFLNSFAFFILYVAVFLAVISPLYVIYLLISDAE